MLSLPMSRRSKPLKMQLHGFSWNFCSTLLQLFQNLSRVAAIWNSCGGPVPKNFDELCIIEHLIWGANGGGSGEETDRQTRRTDGQTDGQTDRQTDRRTDRQTDRRTDRHTDRQTDGQTDIQTDRPRVVDRVGVGFAPHIKCSIMHSS